MPTRKTNPVTTAHHKQLLRDFYDHLYDESFLGHLFKGEDDNDAGFVINSDESDENNDCVEVDNPAMDLDDNNSAEENSAETLSDNTQRKQKVF